MNSHNTYILKTALLLAMLAPATPLALAQGGPFSGLDLNADGIIEIEEVREQRRGVFAGLDLDRNGFLTPEEASAAPNAARRRPGQTKADMSRQMFEGADKDADGLISEAEYVDAMTPLLSRIDTNGDGRVDATELQAFQERLAAARRR